MENKPSIIPSGFASRQLPFPLFTQRWVYVDDGASTSRTIAVIPMLELIYTVFANVSLIGIHIHTLCVCLIVTFIRVMHIVDMM